MTRLTCPAFRDRETDIIDAYELGDCTYEQAHKYLEELYQDYFEAHAVMRCLKENNHCH